MANLLEKNLKKKQLLSVVGPTASGKTDLAIKIIQKWQQEQKKVEVVSLDTRQIYKQLPILSGADLENYQALLSTCLMPAEITETELIKTESEQIRIFNLANRQIDEAWSMGQMLTQLQLILRVAEQNDRRVILVGGTILYHQRVLQANQLVQIPPNDNLRFAAEAMSVAQLQNWLKKIDEPTWLQLNESDRSNQRRLIRKIEIALYRRVCHNQISNNKVEQQSYWQQVFVQPDYQLEDLEQKIVKRVQKRLMSGVVAEVEKVYKQYSGLWGDENWQSKMPLGFKEITQLLKQEIDEKTCEQLWSLHEWQYAKRQLTFLKKLTLDNNAYLIDQREILAN